MHGFIDNCDWQGVNNFLVSDIILLVALFQAQIKCDQSNVCEEIIVEREIHRIFFHILICKCRNFSALDTVTRKADVGLKISQGSICKFYYDRN